MKIKLLGGIFCLSVLMAGCLPETAPTTVIEIPLIGPTVSTVTVVTDTENPAQPEVDPSATSTSAEVDTQEGTDTVDEAQTPTDTPGPTSTSGPTSTNTPGPTATSGPTSTPAPTSTPLPTGPSEVYETFASGFTHAVAIDFLPDGRMLVTEKDGRVLIVNGGQVSTTPVLTISAESDNECGLLGIAVDPSFATNRYVWIYYSTPDPNKGNQIVRFTLNNDKASDVQVAKHFPRLGGVCGHNGGNLHFGPDGKLYVSIGDNEDPSNAQQLGDNHAGKIHRFDPTVPLGIPPDNPISGSSIYAYGFRNPFDFTFDPQSGSIWATENGTYCDDEINRVVPGGNYGWRPEANNACENSKVGDDYPYFRPIINFDSSQAPTGIMFYTGNLFPQWVDRMFFCSFTNKWIRLIDLDSGRLGAIGMYRIPNDVDVYRCETSIMTGPDGAIYFTDPTSINRIVAGS